MSRRRGYKFTNKRHTRNGKIACIFGLLSLLVLGGLFYCAYALEGGAGRIAGVAGLFAMIACIAGLVFSIKGLREEECYYILAYVGVVLNGLQVIGWIFLYVLGM